MRYQLLISLIFLNIVTTQAMERANFFAFLMFAHVVEPEIFFQHNQSKRHRVFYDQPDKQRFNKIVHDTKPKKGYASEKRLITPRNKIRGK